ncbi:hypothetical protein ABZ746_34435 [Streptomyces sp. NPDC020096]
MDVRWLSNTAAPLRTRLYNSSSISVQLPLTNEQLLALEEHRAGGPFTLELRLRAYVAEHDVADDSVQIWVPASVWQDELERLGQAVAFTLSVPVPAAEGAQREAADYLLDARRLLNAGRYDKAIGSARQAMERAFDLTQWPAIARTDDPRERSQGQRWRAIYKAAYDQASGAEHADEVTKDFTYSRAEAEALIGIAAALLNIAPSPQT